MLARSTKPMQRKVPLRNRAAPPPRPAKQTSSLARPREVATAAAPLPMAKPVQKEAPQRSEKYLRAVASLRCYRCHIEGRSQAAHGDFLKAMSLKTDDRTAWPACADGPGFEGCHTYVGRQMPREHRREFEARAARDTRAQIRAMGLWPAGLPHYPDEDPTTTPRNEGEPA